MEGIYDDLILGNGADGLYSTDPRKSNVNNNTLVISSSGGGKTKSVVEPNILYSQNRSMVVTMTKRRLINQYSLVLKERGYDVKLMDLVHPELSDVGYDPMVHAMTESDLKMLSQNIISCTGDNAEKDRYWQNSSASLFRAFAKLAIHKFGRRARMKDVQYLLRFIDEEQSEYVDEDTGNVSVSEYCPKEDFERLKRIDPRMYEDWQQYYANADGTRNNIRCIMQTALNTLFTDGLQVMMNKASQIDFKDLARQKTVLFILTSPVNPALHPFANLVLGTMFKELFEYGEEFPDGQIPVPLMVFCDDFATGGRIPDFQYHISIFREKGISVMMLVQSLSQLSFMYGKDAASTIIDNTDNVVYLGGNDPDTAREIGRRNNKPEDEVLSLPVGREYLFRRGQKPLELQRYRIYEDPLYKQLFTEKGIIKRNVGALR